MRRTLHRERKAASRYNGLTAPDVAMRFHGREGVGGWLAILDDLRFSSDTKMWWEEITRADSRASRVACEAAPQRADATRAETPSSRRFLATHRESTALFPLFLLRQRASGRAVSRLHIRLAR